MKVFPIDHVFSLTLLFIGFTFLSVNAQNEVTQADTIGIPNSEKIAEEFKLKKDIDYSGVFNSHFDHDPVVSSEEIEASFTSDATRIMQSKIAGLSISANSYSPGASSRIMMRGFRSINGNNQPLILLNGMPIDNSEWNNTLRHTDQSNRLLDIDPKFIESIEVIKSAAGRAKYGIVGGNGIIHIKTKRGYRSKPRITFTSSYGIDKISNKILLQNTYAQGKTFSGEQMYRGPETRETSSWGPRISDLFYNDDVIYPFDKNGRLFYDPGNDGKPANIYDPYDFFESGSNTDLSLNVAGGGQKLDYVFTASSKNQHGIIPTTNYKRYNLSSALSYDISSKLSLQLNVLLSKSNAQRNITGANLDGIMLGLLRTATTFDNSNDVEDPVNDPSAYKLFSGSQRSFNFGVYSNPYWSVNKSKHKDIVNRQIVKLSGQYEVSERLDLLFNVGSDSYKDFRQGGTDINPNISFGKAYERIVNYDAQAIDLSAKYYIKSSDVLKISSTIGFNHNRSEIAYEITEGFELRSPNNVTVGNLEVVDSSFATNQVKRSGGVVALDLTYKDFLNISGSLKQDYSNKFGEKTKGFLSYGLGAGISITDLLSAYKSEAVDHPIDFGILASIGKFGNGSENAGAFGKYVKANISGDGFISTTALNDLEINSIVKGEHLTSETINAYDMGVDLAFKKAKINLSVIYYNELSEGLIIREPIAASSGARFLESNVGSLTNKGFDVSFSSEPVSLDKMTWALKIDFNKNKNNIRDIGENNAEVNIGGFERNGRSSALVDYPYGSIQGYGFQRNDEGLMIIDVNGWPLSDPELKVIADPNPDWTMYITNTFKIGQNLTLNATVDIKQGGDMYCGTCGTLDYLGKSERSAEERGTSVVFEGVTQTGSKNTKSVELAPDSGSSPAYYRVRYAFGGIGEMNIYDASWIRLRNISISYDLSDIIELKALKNMSLSFFAENLFIKTDYPSIDPETNLSGNSGLIGLDYYNNPGSRRYGLTLQASF